MARTEIYYIARAFFQSRIYCLISESLLLIKKKQCDDICHSKLSGACHSKKCMREYIALRKFIN